MAQRAAARLRSDQSEYSWEIVDLLFKRRLDNEEVQTKVLGTFQEIAAMYENSDRITSDVRFYCDDDTYGDAGAIGPRWTAVPDDPHDTKPNSQRTREKDKEFEDRTNFLKMGMKMALDGPETTKGCDLSGNSLNPTMDTLAELFFLPSSRPAPSNENPKRVVISLCHWVYRNDQDVSGMAYETFFLNQNFPGDKDSNILSWANYAGGSAILHELTHWDFGFSQTVDHSYWPEQSLAALPPAKIIENADNFLWYALLAGAADHKFRQIFKPAEDLRSDADKEANPLKPYFVKDDDLRAIA